jgi:hypothetical protein
MHKIVLIIVYFGELFKQSKDYRKVFIENVPNNLVAFQNKFLPFFLCSTTGMACVDQAIRE